MYVVNQTSDKFENNDLLSNTELQLSFLFTIFDLKPK